MATTMEGRVLLPAPRQTVWAGLNDPETLRRCISGCETLEKVSDTHFVATARVKMGPLRATIRGQVNLEYVDPPNGCRLVGAGEGGFAGFAKGIADVRLADAPEGTLLTYTVEANVGGRLAQLGSWLIDGAAKRIAERFFARFAAAISDSAVPIAAPALAPQQA